MAMPENVGQNQIEVYVDYLRGFNNPAMNTFLDVVLEYGNNYDQFGFVVHLIRLMVDDEYLPSFAIEMQDRCKQYFELQSETDYQEYLKITGSDETLG